MGTADQCWLWMGAKNALGYGRFKQAGKTYQAHRVAFALRWGDSPHTIHHRCDTPSCVNPEHLYDQTSERKPGRTSAKKKPHKDFPLFPHARYWAKKVRGKLEYFGKIADDPKGVAALELWLKHKDNLLAGRSRREESEGLTVEDLCDHFLNAKRSFVASGELTKRMFDEYFATCERLVKEFGLKRLVEDIRPDDFARFRSMAAARWGVHRLSSEIQRVRTIFNFGVQSELIERVIRFGPSFKKPSKRVLRLARAEKGLKMFEAAEIGRLLALAGPQMKAMILLGINCGFGNSDCGQLTMRAVNLSKGWIDFPRPKTGIDRRCPLWPETIAALQQVLTERPEPKDPAHAELLFVTKYRGAWFKPGKDNPVTKECVKLQRSLGIHRPGLAFYGLRHTFRTIADGTRDQVACNHIMGHADESMGATYRERIADERLIAVADHVRGHVFPTSGNASGKGGAV